MVGSVGAVVAFSFWERWLSGNMLVLTAPRDVAVIFALARELHKVDGDC